MSRFITAITVALGLLVGAGTASAQTYNLTLTGASPKGLWSLLGVGTNAALSSAFPGSTITYQTSGGGLANIPLVSQGRAHMGIAHNIELVVASKGSAPFKAPFKNLRAIAYMYNWAPMQMIVTKDFAEKYGITSMDDLKAKKPPVRIAVNQRGNMVQDMNQKILAAYGITYKDIESWGGQIVYSPGREQGQLMSDRRVDMIGNGVFVPYRYFVQVSKSRDLKILPLRDDVIKKVAADTGADPYTISAGGYPWQPQEIKTVALGAVLFASDTMSNTDAYNITKALIDNVGKVQGVHKAMKNLTPKLMASQTSIPYHSGALRAYKEAGLK